MSTGPQPEAGQDVPEDRLRRGVSLLPSTKGSILASAEGDTKYEHVEAVAHGEMHVLRAIRDLISADSQLLALPVPGREGVVKAVAPRPGCAATGAR